jgi:photosystem II stability/assembly factor-like uncharacterized protein
MGFTVAGERHFLGSGHPDVQGLQEENLPPLLGLIETQDGGKTWQSISLLGEADFHILRFAAERVYGFDATNARLLLSVNGGKTWMTQSLPGFPPEPLVDLVIDPADSVHVIASSASALYESTNAGATWRLIGRDAGLLAWPSARRLLLVPPDGRVLVSADEGERWDRLGEIGVQPTALLAANERDLYAAVADGTIVASTDGGATWRVRSQSL